jgi:hypothetical protein
MHLKSENSLTNFCSQDLPFGGTKASGYGRFGKIYLLFDNFVTEDISIPAGPEGLRSLTNPKAIIVDRWPSLIQTTIPKVLDYPLRSLKHSWFVLLFSLSMDIYSYLCHCRDFSSGLIRFLYGDGWRTSINGLITVIGAARK